VVRILSAFVLAVFLSQFTLAFAFPCISWDGACGSCEDDSGEHEDDGHKRCPCPLDCGPSCAGSALRAIPPAPLDLVLPSPFAAAILWRGADRAPPSLDPDEIVHVPRSGA
jgi:hypothetical protein